MKKLRLNDLEVKSIVTSMDKQITYTVKGGFTNQQQTGCNSASPQECGIDTQFLNCPTIFTDCACGTGPVTYDGPTCNPLKTIIVKICF